MREAETSCKSDEQVRAAEQINEVQAECVSSLEVPQNPGAAKLRSAALQHNNAEEALALVGKYRPTLAAVLNASGSLQLDIYAAQLFERKNTASPELLDVVSKIASRQVGSALAEKLVAQLRECPTINTGVHHGPLFQENTFQSLLLTASGVRRQGLEIVPVFGGTVIPLDISDFPRGIFWHAQRVGIFPSALYNTLVHSCPPCSREQIEALPTGAKTAAVREYLKSHFPQIDAALSSGERGAFWEIVSNAANSGEVIGLKRMLGMSTAPVQNIEDFIAAFERAYSAQESSSDFSQNNLGTIKKKVVGILRDQFPELRTVLDEAERGTFWSRIGAAVAGRMMYGEDYARKGILLALNPQGESSEQGVSGLRLGVQDPVVFMQKFNEACALGNKAAADVQRLVVDTLPDEIFDRASCPSYSQQISLINAALWKRAVSGIKDAPQLVYLPLEEISGELVRRSVLAEQPNVVQKMLLNEEARELALTHFEGIQGTWDAAGTEGTHFFWGISSNGEMVSLRSDREKLRGRKGDEFIEIALTAAGISQALADRKIAPCILLTITELLRHGAVPLGGYNQVDYSTVMKERLQSYMTALGMNDESAALEGTTTRAMLYGPALALARLPSGTLKVAGADEFIRDPERNGAQFEKNVSAWSLREGMAIGVIDESYLEVVPAEERKGIQINVESASQALGLTHNEESFGSVTASAPLRKRISTTQYQERTASIFEPTPIIQSSVLGRESAVPDLHFKLGGHGLTGSLYERTGVGLVLRALEGNFTEITIAGRGSLGSAIASAARDTGIQATIFLGSYAEEKHVKELNALGAIVVNVNGDYEAAVAASQEHADKGAFDGNPQGQHRDVFLQTSAKLAHEIVDQLGQPPRYLALPIGSGATISGLYAAFQQMKQAGAISEVPSMIGGSAFLMNAIAAALRHKLPQYRDLSRSQMKVTPINAPLALWHAADGDAAMSAVRESNGFCMQFKDQDLINYREMLLKSEGIAASPSAVAGLAAVLEQQKVALQPGAKRSPLEARTCLVLLPELGEN